jgi:Cu(I)/Ag(I) efflux system membrane fusion protein
MLDDLTRTVRIPVHIDNRDHVLKPGMFVSATIRAALAADGAAAPTGVEGKFTCPMHPQVLEATPGTCPSCAMDLERVPGAPAPDATGPVAAPAPAYACPMRCEGDRTYADAAVRCPVCGMRLERIESAAEASRRGLLAVPASAVLDSGLRRLVYVTRGEGRFEPREVTLGPRAEGYVAVLGGLAEGERVATRGGFLIDSQFQITGHPSLFYPGGLMAGGGAHAGHGGAGGAGGAEPAPPSGSASGPAHGAAAAPDGGHE